MQLSLSALRAFDAAARQGSFRGAADTLSITPTAISHHIRGLEDLLGLKLFDRSTRNVTLTGDGKRLADTTGKAFGMLEDTVNALQRTSRNVVRLAAGPIFTARWLMPRISDLWDKLPDIELEVVPSYRPRVGDKSYADIVISWDRLAEMSASTPKLLELRPVAIASKEYIDLHGAVEGPHDLLSRPILHQRDHWGWLDWFAAMHVEIDRPLQGPVFEDANVLLRGASEGQGAIIGWLPLIDQDLREGRVVRLFDEDIEPTHGYYIQKAEEVRTRLETQSVIDWLTSQRI